MTYFNFTGVPNSVPKYFSEDIFYEQLDFTQSNFSATTFLRSYQKSEFIPGKMI